jgi:hypothetical protein
MSRLASCIFVGLLGSGILHGCKPLQGHEADLATLATPDSVPKAVHILPQPPPGPVPAEGAFRAWVPRQVAANGDVIDGHWITVSLTPPAQEVIEPVKPMPRAPRMHVAPKPAGAPPQPVPPPPQASPPQNNPPLTPARALVPQPWLGGQ